MTELRVGSIVPAGMPAAPLTEQAWNDASRVRLVLSRELETISQYEELAARAESPEVRAFFLHLAAEEKEHVAEAVNVLRKLDADQNAHFERDVGAHLTSLDAVTGIPSVPNNGGPVTSAPSPLADLRLPTSIERVVHALPHSPHPLAGSFTVGPLKARR